MEAPEGIRYVPGETVGDTSSSDTDESGMDEFLTDEDADAEADTTEGEQESELSGNSPPRRFFKFKPKRDSTPPSSSDENNTESDPKTDSDSKWETDDSDYEPVTEWPKPEEPEKDEDGESAEEEEAEREPSLSEKRGDKHELHSILRRQSRHELPRRAEIKSGAKRVKLRLKPKYFERYPEAEVEVMNEVTQDKNSVDVNQNANEDTDDDISSSALDDEHAERDLVNKDEHAERDLVNEDEHAERDLVNEDADADQIPIYPPNLLARRLYTSPMDSDMEDQPVTKSESDSARLPEKAENENRAQRLDTSPVLSDVEELPVSPPPSTKPNKAGSKFDRKHFNKKGDPTVVLPKDVLERRRMTSPIHPTVEEEVKIRKQRADDAKTNHVPPPSKEEENIININLRRRRKLPLPNLFPYNPEEFPAPKRPPTNPNTWKPWTKRSNPYCEGDGNCEWCDILNISDEERLAQQEPRNHFGKFIDEGITMDSTEEEFFGVVNPNKKKRKKRKRSFQEKAEERRYYRDIKVMQRFARKTRKVTERPSYRDEAIMAEEYICENFFAPVLKFIWNKVLRMPWILKKLDKIWYRIASKFLPPNEEDVPTRYWVHKNDIDDEFRKAFHVEGTDGEISQTEPEPEPDNDEEIEFPEFDDGDSVNSDYEKIMTSKEFEKYKKEVHKSRTTIFRLFSSSSSSSETNSDEGSG